VKQQVIPVKQADGSRAEFDFTAYDAQWKNGHAFLNNFQDLIDTQVGYVEKAIFTAKRKLFKKQQTSPLYHNQNIDFYLSFSEPIKRPLDANSGFELGFKLVSARGELPVSEQTIMLDMSTEVVEIIDLDDSSNPRVLAIRDEFPEYKVFDQHMKGSRWLITVDGSKIADIEGLYGAVRLVVKAKDKNQHDSVLGGADLDDKPRTPARMKATLEGSGGTLKPIFKWYDGEEALTAEFAGSKESNDTPITPQHFSYDRKNGDQNHILWFSPKVTDADLIKQINNNSGQGYDDVSITGMPKEDVKK
jgi:hypothetical protein